MINSIKGYSVHNAALKGCIVEGCSGHVQSSGLQRAQWSIKGCIVKGCSGHVQSSGLQRAQCSIRGCIVEGCSGHVQSSGLQRAQWSIKGCIVKGCSGQVQSSGLQRAQCSIKGCIVESCSSHVQRSGLQHEGLQRSMCTLFMHYVDCRVLSACTCFGLQYTVQLSELTVCNVYCHGQCAMCNELCVICSVHFDFAIYDVPRIY